MTGGDGGVIWSGGGAASDPAAGTFDTGTVQDVPQPSSAQAVGPWVGDHSAYIAADGVQASGGWADDAGSRDPSSDTVAGSIANAVAAMIEMNGDIMAAGGSVGDLVPLPVDAYTPSVSDDVGGPTVPWELNPSQESTP